MLVLLLLCCSIVITSLRAERTPNNILERPQTMSQQRKFPQEPQAPFPYAQEDVTYQNITADITLAGTLTKPTGTGHFPTVILIGGYGPNTRNLPMMGHQRFLVLADYLTRQGLAVLRFDKRGTGQSTGDYSTATSYDFAQDVLAALTYLKTRPDIDHQRMGLIGHSEGGMIAAMVAAASPDVKFIISMAGVGQTNIDALVEQTARQLQADGASETMLAHDRNLRQQFFTIITHTEDPVIAAEQLHGLIHNYWATLPASCKVETAKLPFAITQANAELMVKTLNGAWYRYFLSYSPTDTLRQVKVPVLVISGDLDWIVSPQQTFPVIKQALQEAGNQDTTLQIIPHLNHVFQTCSTGSMAEYATLHETISPLVLKAMSDWILARTIKL